MIADRPLVSVIIPCFNQGHFLNECLDSLLDQTYDNWECIIVDDGSSDSTRFVAETFLTRDSRVSYCYQENRGLSGARNTGIQKSHGRYLNFLDADDKLDPRMLNKSMQVMMTNDDTVLVFCGYFLARGNFRHVIKSLVPDHDLSSEDFFVQFCKARIFPVHAGIIRSDLIKEIGLFDEDLKGCEDWDFWLRLARYSTRINVVKEPLVYYRMTVGSMTRNVEPYYQSGMKVLNRIVTNDARIRFPRTEYANGCPELYEEIFRFWHLKCAGLAISSCKIDFAEIMITRLCRKGNAILSSHDFVQIWKFVVYGLIAFDERTKAWKLHKDNFLRIVSAAEDRCGSLNLRTSVLKLISYYNAGFLGRLTILLVERFIEPFRHLFPTKGSLNE